MKINNIDIKYYLYRYIQEVLEAFIAFLLYKFISKEKIVYDKVIYMSLIIGSITLLLEEYNDSYKKSVKSGIMINIGSQLLKT